MFNIIHEGEIVGAQDSPNFVKHKNGILVNCAEEEAEGIAVSGTFYEGAMAIKEDTAEEYHKQSKALDILEEDHVVTEETMCDTMIEFTERLEELEETICDLIDQITQLTESEE